jgi:hypothetical protein
VLIQLKWAIDTLNYDRKMNRYISAMEKADGTKRLDNEIYQKIIK